MAKRTVPPDLNLKNIEVPPFSEPEPVLSLPDSATKKQKEALRKKYSEERKAWEARKEQYRKDYLKSERARRTALREELQKEKERLKKVTRVPEVEEDGDVPTLTLIDGEIPGDVLNAYCQAQAKKISLKRKNTGAPTFQQVKKKRKKSEDEADANFAKNLKHLVNHGASAVPFGQEEEEEEAAPPQKESFDLIVDRIRMMQDELNKAIQLMTDVKNAKKFLKQAVDEGCSFEALELAIGELKAKTQSKQPRSPSMSPVSETIMVSKPAWSPSNSPREKSPTSTPLSAKTTPRSASPRHPH